MLGKSKKHIIAPILATLCYGTALVINKDLVKPKIVVSKQDSALNFNTTFLKLFSLGNKRFISDLIWIQTLLESDESHYKNNDFNSWMFVRFKNITELDPNFYQNYLWGGIYLSIIKDDRLGAAEIFERGIAQFPNDYDLYYNAGFNYYAQLGNYQRAYELFSAIQNHSKAPSFLSTLTAKIKFQTDFDYDGAIKILYERYLNSEDEYLKAHIQKSIYALKADRDLKCLNENGKDCEFKDAEGNFYLKKSDRFYAPKEYTPYQIFKK